MTADPDHDAGSITVATAAAAGLRAIAACAELGAEMLAAARLDDWREVRRLEQHRRQLASQLRFDDLSGDQAGELLPAMRELVAQTATLDELARQELAQRSRALARGRQSADAVSAYVHEQHGLKTSRSPDR